MILFFGVHKQAHDPHSPPLDFRIRLTCGGHVQCFGPGVPELAGLYNLFGFSGNWSL